MQAHRRGPIVAVGDFLASLSKSWGCASGQTSRYRWCRVSVHYHLSRNVRLVIGAGIRLVGAAVSEDFESRRALRLNLQVRTPIALLATTDPHRHHVEPRAARTRPPCLVGLEVREGSPGESRRPSPSSVSLGSSVRWSFLGGCGPLQSPAPRPEMAALFVHVKAQRHHVPRCFVLRENETVDARLARPPVYSENLVCFLLASRVGRSSSCPAAPASPRWYFFEILFRERHQQFTSGL